MTAQDATIAPPSPQPEEAVAADVRAIAETHAGAEGALLPILVAVQRRFGWIPDGAAAAIADILNVSRADVAGVIGFYTDFRTARPAAIAVQICRAEACQAAGGEALAAHAEKRLECAFGAAREDGAASLDAVYCFGNCALAPAAAVDGRLIGRATPTKLDAALDAAEAAP